MHVRSLTFPSPASRPSSRRCGSRSVHVRHDGRCVVRTMYPGRHRVVASSRDGESFASSDVDIVAGATKELAIALAPAAQLTLVYDGPHERVSCEVRQGGVVVRAPPLEPTLRVTIPLAPGAVSVRVSAEGASLQECNLNLTSGSARMLMLDG